MSFSLVTYGFAPSGYRPGVTLVLPLMQPTTFVFPPTTLWSTRISRFIEDKTCGRITSVTLELLEGNLLVYHRTMTENEYNTIPVCTSSSKLPWSNFIRVLKVLMLANRQEHQSNIDEAFAILDQQRKTTCGSNANIPDGLISSDELKAFLSIICPQAYIDVCVRLADTNRSGQIDRSEFTQMIRSGLSRDIVCGLI
ncbi:unnamed protein product [Rotaria magnacalcarata]|uniref:EF-hand domain-containing protein n=1 Tax=Rotaria magnacalcarata TaxID=392030 RepID=A0A815VJ81_9BILA|nr:unnamed protein product [Rotaria magnacalcarata]CAF1536462.1 unnamed protein product [Rotaria magnacalcarata]CAF2123213.1 unnamed protein product [Rotaria magnacalcarata]CAF2152662.1 unnamed protein product [Rotaria magnacalcarata]CAF2244212.1 unnamed protein product [Rotaria magnacalcarata]